MIARIRGQIVKQEESKVIISVGGIAYEINVPTTVSLVLQNQKQDTVELVIYHYIAIDKNRGLPVMIGFLDELEKDFFEKFISVVGIGPRAALRAFDRPIAAIAAAIEEGDLNFLTSLSGIGPQKAKQIVASLQGKVGRFALLKSDRVEIRPLRRELVEEAKSILHRLQYNDKEAEEMIRKALAVKSQVENVEELLNEIYCQRR